MSHAVVITCEQAAALPPNMMMLTLVCTALANQSMTHYKSKQPVNASAQVSATNDQPLLLLVWEL